MIEMQKVLFIKKKKEKMEMLLISQCIGQSKFFKYSAFNEFRICWTL